MPQIGIRQLKNETSAIIRAVREQKVEYVVTHHGEPVAIIRPVTTAVAGIDEILNLATAVFDGLDETVVTEIEEAISRRPDFFGNREDPAV